MEGVVDLQDRVENELTKEREMDLSVFCVSGVFMCYVCGICWMWKQGSSMQGWGWDERRWKGRKIKKVLRWRRCDCSTTCLFLCAEYISRLAFLCWTTFTTSCSITPATHHWHLQQQYSHSYIHQIHTSNQRCCKRLADKFMDYIFRLSTREKTRLSHSS